MSLKQLKNLITQEVGKVVNYIRNLFFERIVKPLIISVSPVDEVALGMSIGMFVGMTPTVGIQMWMVFVIWLFFKYVLGIRFDLIIGTAIVWISNPLTMFFLYYGFLATGVFVFSSFGFDVIPLDYNSFYNRFHDALNKPDASYLSAIIDGTRFLFIELGVPMFVGSLFYAVPCAILSYILTQRLLLRYRKKKAKKMGMSYEVWKQTHEKAKLKTKKNYHQTK